MIAAILFLPLSLHAGKNSGDPGHFQASYDQEAIGHYQEALNALDELSAKEGSYVAQLRKGWLHYRLGMNGPAVEAYNKAIVLAPRAVEPRLGVLLPLLAGKQWQTAEKHARELLKLDPQNYFGTLRLAFALYNQNKLVESQRLYEKLVDAYPSDTDARSGLGWALLKQGRTAEAAAVFRALLDFAPKNALGQQGIAAANAK
jgi:tetratricopeptide (TPR) repeat protein